MKKKMLKAINTEGNICYCPYFAGGLDTLIPMLEEAGVTNIELFEVDKMPLEKLPEEIQQEVRQTLKAYQRCNVYFEYGKFHTRTGYCVKAEYNFDHFVCGEYKASDVYTEEERRQNFIESFGYAPCH